MTGNQIKIITESRLFVIKLLSEKVESRFAFHNLRHTKDVVSAAKTISGSYKLRKDDYFALILAAWFHDTGFSEGKIENHENSSIDIARKFLHGKVSRNIVAKVVSCIRATKLPQTPNSLVERILCDADLFHLGTTNFKQRTNLLKEEIETYFDKKISKEHWQKANIEFISQHRYFSKYARRLLQPKVDKWLRSQTLPNSE